MTKPVIIAMIAATLSGVAAFIPATSHTHSHHSTCFIPAPTGQFAPQTSSSDQITRSITSLQMCICIHCAHVTNCSAYNFVEEQHSQPHINKSPTWEPRNGSPTIEVHIRPDANTKAENELGKMWGEHEDQTRQAEEAVETNGKGDVPLFGEKQYDLSGTTSYEYDVVECEDFIQDKDKWVRNMPDEIRIANPDFVPT
mmetsp:Transcript_31859/g.66969  ORF Transcript_31859/g.66969 Transcript_31859/m.66969 type:complete len:198 (+) Transcript_31859:108-701(+)|eukprot:CAMPEP_0172321222 /NCGR_PEP_ID=MMETSP1058-20130122/42725_1 /TAXON_ID=83371 /ORGANISM="Detonula confervacea, Strain CCMP 353" /LENGTH=197 /DNA_ID=CAMNT_0013036667 /DNA_START=22 /DNA_END=615 /DNA_ORIENTATION=-